MSDHNKLVSGREDSSLDSGESPGTPSPDDGVTPTVGVDSTARDGFFPYNEEKAMQSVQGFYFYFMFIC